MAAPAFKESTSASSSGASSLAIDYPDASTAIASGDDLVCFVSGDQGDGTGTTITGFTRLAEFFDDNGSNSLYTAIFHRIADGTETDTVTITMGGSFNDGISAIMMRYDGSDGDTAPANSIKGSQETTTPNADGTAVPDGDEVRVVVAYSINSNGARFSANPSGYGNGIQEEGNGSGCGAAAADNTFTGDGTTVYGDETWTITAAVRSACCHVVLTGASTGITGTGSYTLPSLTYSGSGSVIITGTGSYTLPSLTYSGTGSVIITGTGSYTLPSLTYSGSGTVIITGTGSYTLPSLIYSGTGSVIITGTGSYTLPSLTYAGTGAVGIVSGTGSYTLPSLTYAGSGTVIITGTGSYTLPSLTYAGTGSVIITGTGTYTLPSFTYSGTGSVGAITGTGTYTLPSLTYSGTGTVIISGTGSYTLPSLTYSGTGTTPDVLVAEDVIVLPNYDGIIVLPAYDGIITLPKT